MSKKIAQEEIDFVGAIDIISVVEHEGFKLHKNGSTYECLCPFHNDGHRGSFKVFTSRKGRFKCFACGEGGDKITFIQKLHNMSYPEAIHYISGSFGYSGDSTSLPAPPPVVQTEEQAAKKKGSSVILNLAYEAFFRASSGLTPRLRKYLSGERHLTEEQMQDFFIFPSWHDEDFWRRFERELSNRKLKTSALLLVPGFYVRNEPSCISFVSYKDAYGMLCRNTDGLIIGIQVGFFNPNPDRPKYLWFSSGNVEEKGYGTRGTASGAPYDISYPGTGIKRFPAIAITEGKYKAMALAATGMPTINIHGVSNLRNLKNQVAELSKQMGVTPSILIALDSDIFQNEGVATAAKRITEFFQETHKVYIAYWDMALGKGFDDLVNNGNYSQVKKMRAADFVQLYIDPFLESIKE